MGIVPRKIKENSDLRLNARMRCRADSILKRDRQRQVALMAHIAVEISCDKEDTHNLLNDLG